ncbi:MAG: response regulator [Ignavibacteria bacterium]|nr:MAG: response regulator [Ignavibacteria bacterium]
MKEKILVVEDDNFSQEFYRFLLTKNGYDVTVTDDVDVILNKLDEMPVLIIMDVNLTNSFLNGEKVDGIKLSSYIKSQEKYSHIPILVITAHSFEAERKRILEESLADGLFPKPIYDFNKLISKINELKAVAA